jgi:hypothetical protein
MTPLSCRSYRDLSDLFFYMEPTAGNVLQRAGVTWFTWLLIALPTRDSWAWHGLFSL